MHKSNDFHSLIGTFFYSSLLSPNVCMFLLFHCFYLFGRGCANLRTHSCQSSLSIININQTVEIFSVSICLRYTNLLIHLMFVFDSFFCMILEQSRKSRKCWPRLKPNLCGNPLESNGLTRHQTLPQSAAIGIVDNGKRNDL